MKLMHSLSLLILIPVTTLLVHHLRNSSYLFIKFQDLTGQNDGLMSWLGNGRDILDGSCGSFTVIFLILISNLGYDVANVLADILAHRITGHFFNGFTVNLYADMLFLCLLDLSVDVLYLFLVDPCMMEFHACIDGVEDASESQKHQYCYGHVGRKVYFSIIGLISLIEEEDGQEDHDAAVQDGHQLG